MKSTSGFWRRLALLGLCTLLPVAPAGAQVLEEMIVTAQKREQNLSDVGISVTAFSGTQLEQLGLTETTQLGAQVPGLMVTDFGGGVTTAFTIRGSGQLDFGDHQEGPVAVYIDDVYNSYLAGVGFSFFDVDRVEVLRGPQGTLFGRNATGGVVQLISRRPDRETSGYAELTLGDYGQVRTEAALGGALSNSVAGRLSLAYEQTDGFQENRVGDDLNDVNNFSVRGQLLFDLSEDATLLLNAHGSTDDTNGQGYSIRRGLVDIGGIPGLPGDGLVHEGNDAQFDAFCAGFFGPGFPIASGATNCFGYTEPDHDPHSVSSNEKGFFKRDHVGITATLDWDLSESWRLVSITDWQDFSKGYFDDSDATPDDLFTFPQSMDSNQYSEELRLHGTFDRLNVVTGVYYLDIDGDFRAGTNTFNCCLTQFDNRYALETKSWAAFAQLDYEVAPAWTLIAGLRWTQDDKHMAVNPLCIDAGPGADFGLPADPCDFFFGGSAQTGPAFGGSRSEGEWSGVLEADWRPLEDWLLYLKYSRGNKAGGFNAGAAVLFDAATFEFDGEVLTSYESGFKAEFLDGRVRLNASVYLYDYSDFQSFSQQGPNLVVFNTNAENLGAELELVLNPVDGLEFLLGVSHQDAVQQDVSYAGVTRDRPMPNAPDLTVNGLARYEWGMFGGRGSVQLDFNYVDARALNGIDHPALIDDDYTLVNARLGYATEDGTWDFSLWGKNLGDTEYTPTALDTTVFTGVILDAPGAPRWYGATLRYNLR